jgi:hypothetical protein
MLQLPFHTKRKPIHDIIGVLEKSLDPAVNGLSELSYATVLPGT